MPPQEGKMDDNLFTQAHVQYVIGWDNFKKDQHQQQEKHYKSFSNTHSLLKQAE